MRKQKRQKEREEVSKGENRRKERGKTHKGFRSQCIVTYHCVTSEN
jgi:hypothetical protein